MSRAFSVASVVLIILTTLCGTSSISCDEGDGCSNISISVQDEKLILYCIGTNSCDNIQLNNDNNTANTTVEIECLGPYSCSQIRTDLSNILEFQLHHYKTHSFGQHQ